ncbi:hypothetical protein DAPPUDRAFT_323416 [Daphnia pulex]|uniref:G-protein coupled receptors family 1 profile domain-containing protein n=1 Tax=Daphnia pulex TaxID=6669 RepID=E9GYT7_DAPPU|nr:hypothetical protein DAPPUDRAFT_323416 [Daphnia pulex]|eukprot:EFX75355.1 hypothetical protein DAPPUDRAFT_323416 [Daphnia pulex]
MEVLTEAKLMNSTKIKLVKGYLAYKRTINVEINKWKAECDKLKEELLAEKGSFPIKESVKRSIKKKYPHPEKQYTCSWKTSTALSIWKYTRKTKKGATKGTSLKISMDPKELQEIRVFLCSYSLLLPHCSPMLFLANYLEADENTAGSSAGCVTQANTFWSVFFYIAAICLFFLLPLIVLVLNYSVIARHLVADPCTTSNHRNSLLFGRTQVVSMLGTMVVFFFICFLPFKIFTLWFILTSDEDIQMMGPETYYHVLNFCRVMFYLNSAINPILYNVMSSKFRTAFLKVLGFTWAGQRKRLLHHLSHQSTFNTTNTSGTASHSATTTGNSEHQLIKRMTKEDLLTAASSPRPVLQKYGRQGNCTSATNRASSKSLLTATLSTTSHTSVVNPTESSSSAHHTDSHF